MKSRTPAHTDMLAYLKDALAVAASAPLTHGARNLVAPERPWLHFKNRTVKDFTIDNVRILSRMGVAFEACRLNRFQARNTDLDYFSISGGTLKNASIENVSLFGFDISKSKIDGLKIADSFFGLHIWPEDAAEGVEQLATDLDNYLAGQKTVVQSPYTPQQQNLYASLQENVGKNIEIIRPIGGYAFIGMENNQFEELKITGPGFLIKPRFSHNIFINSTINDMVFLDGEFECNKIGATLAARCIFSNISFLGSIIELTPEWLSSRFVDCAFAQDKKSNSFRLVDDTIFVYEGKAIIGVGIDPETGFLVPDLAIEKEYADPSQQLLNHLAMRREITAAISDMFVENGATKSSFAFFHAGDFPAVPFSSVYPELLRRAAEKNLIAIHHPGYRDARPGCAAVGSYLNTLLLPRPGA